jgi:hypothetical protein
MPWPSKNPDDYRGKPLWPELWPTEPADPSRPKSRWDWVSPWPVRALVFTGSLLIGTTVAVATNTFLPATIGNMTGLTMMWAVEWSYRRRRSADGPKNGSK